MKLLLVSDEESPYFWDYYRPGRLDGIDLILAAGDLKADYLSFLVTMGRAPVLYIHGNHDKTQCHEDRYSLCPGDLFIVFKENIRSLLQELIHDAGSRVITECYADGKGRKNR